MAKPNHHPGPNPDPALYILVKTKEGSWYRRKRGSVKPAALNESLQGHADATKVCSPAAKRMAAHLSPHFRGLQPGRLVARFSSGLKQGYLRGGAATFAGLLHQEVQPTYPLHHLLTLPYTVTVSAQTVMLTVPITGHGVKGHNPLVSHYYFDLVLLWGDAFAERELRTDAETSKLYALDAYDKGGCTLTAHLPEAGVPWMAILKLSCLEGRELAAHPKHYGAKVIATNTVEKG